MGEIIFDDEIPCGDEIRLTAEGWISSERSEDFFAAGDFIKKTTNYDTITTKEGVNMHCEDWIIPFTAIDLCGVILVPIVNDDEDMLEIRWPEGMWIEVGFKRAEKTYFITTVADDTLESWNNPLSVIAITNREELPAMLQKEICRCRS